METASFLAYNGLHWPISLSTVLKLIRMLEGGWRNKETSSFVCKDFPDDCYHRIVGMGRHLWVHLIHPAQSRLSRRLSNISKEAFISEK